MLGPGGEGWLQLGELALAVVLSALVGLEREIRQKSAGLRTYTLVGVASALFMPISKHGFMDVLANGRIIVDPSRIAAQVVSGIGFIGAGLPLLALWRRRPYIRLSCPWFGGWSDSCRDPGVTATDIHVSYGDGCELLLTDLIDCAKLRFTVDTGSSTGDRQTDKSSE